MLKYYFNIIPNMQVRLEIDNNGTEIESNIDFVQTALEYFLKNAKFPIYFGSEPVSLLEYLPLCSQGYAADQTLQLLVMIYAMLNNLTTLTPGVPLDYDITELLSVTPDGLMNTSFNGDIPAYYAKYFEDEITMQKAVEDRIPNFLDYQSTFRVVQIEYPNFNPAM